MKLKLSKTKLVINANKQYPYDYTIERTNWI